MKEVKLNVQMSCNSCAGAVNRILSKVEGVSKLDVSLEGQSVTVSCEDEVSPEILLSALQKWAEAAGKAISLA